MNIVAKLTSTERSRIWRERHPGADAEKTRRYRNTPKGKHNEIKKSRKRRELKLSEKKNRYSINFVPKHGTKNGYDWHMRGAFDKPCFECREAMKAWWVYERTIKERTRGLRPIDYGALQSLYTTSEVLQKYGSDCHICLKPINLDAPKRVGYSGWEMGLHLDHVIPLSRGGDDTIDNIRPSHGICNIKKGAGIR